MAERTVKVRVVGDTSQYESAMDKAAESTKKVDNAAAKAQRRTEMWKKVGRYAQVAGAAMAVGLYKSVKAASEQEQALGSLGAVFDKNEERMRKNAEAAVDLGLSQTDYAQSAAQLGAQLKNLGVSQKDLIPVTEDLIGKAADMAAQFGGTTQEALTAVAALLRGERDPIERFGVSMNEAGIKAEMAAKGIGKTEAVLGILDRQLKSSNTLGALDREFDTTAAAAQRASAQFENAQASLGQALLPTVSKAANALAKLFDWFNQLPGPMKELASWGAVIGTAMLLLAPKIIKVAQSFGRIKDSALSAGRSLKTAQGRLKAFKTFAGGVAFSGLILALGAIVEHMANVRARAEELLGTFSELDGAATRATWQNLGQEFFENFSPGDFDSINQKLTETGHSAIDLGEAMTAAFEGGDTWSNYLSNLEADLDDSYSGMEKLNPAVTNTKNALLSAFEAMNRDATAARDLKEATDSAATAADNQATKTKAAANESQHFASSLGKNKKAMADYVAQVGNIPKKAITKVLLSNDRKSAQSLARYLSKVYDIPEEEITDILLSGDKKALARLKELIGSAKDAGKQKPNIKADTDAGKSTKEINETTKAAKDLDRQSPSVNITDNASSVANNIWSIKSALDNLPANTYVNVYRNLYEQKKSANGGFVDAMAGGGRVFGRGTKTSDSVPAMLSQGEFVQRAAAVDKYGLSFMEALNSGLVDPDDLPKFKKGGSLRLFSKKRYRKQYLKKQTSSSGRMSDYFGWDDEFMSFLDPRWMDYNPTPGIKDPPKNPKIPGKKKNEKQKDYEQRVKEWKKNQAARFKEWNQTRKRTENEWRRTIAAERRDDKWGKFDDAVQLYQQIRDERLQFEESIKSGLVDSLSAFSAFDWSGGTDAVNERAEAEQALYEARIKLNSASPADEAQALRDVLTAQKNLNDARAKEAKSKPTAENINAQFSDRVNRARQYVDGIKKLAAKGLNDAIIQEILSKGVDEGLPMINALSNMDLGQINASQEALDRIGTELGSWAGNRNYGVSEALALANVRNNTPDGMTVSFVGSQPIILKVGSQQIAAAGMKLQRQSGNTWSWVAA